MTMADPGPPAEIKVRRKSRILWVHFRDGESFELPFEYLRVYSPSAEVRGHGPGEGKLELAKEHYRKSLATKTTIFLEYDWCRYRLRQLGEKVD